MWFRRAGLVAALVVASTAVAVAPAAAAPPPPKLSDFDLRPASNAIALTQRVQELDAELPKLGVQNILAQASRDGTAMSGAGAICNPDAVDVRQRDLNAVYSFCFDAADSGTNGGNVEWTPQGMTTVADAQEDQFWGNSQPLLVSWYNNDSEQVKGTRITFVDVHTGAYQHVLLAYPFQNDSGNATYMSLRNNQDSSGSSLHAGGLAWYGNFLYVADTRRGFRVFDMRYIFDLQAAGAKGNLTDKTKIGRQNGVFYGHGYRYVMPEVGAWTSNAGQVGDASTCTVDGAPHFSFVGLDRTGGDHLTTGEYCDGAANGNDPNKTGRVANWPLDGLNGLPAISSDGRWRATSAYRLPVPNVQGAVGHGNTYYLNRSHGKDVPDQNDNGDLLRSTAPSGTTGTLGTPVRRTAPVGPEDLSYWSDFYGFGDVLFSITEHPTQRMVYATPVSAF
ncbi:hypothetical protein Ais01nite_71010 [Asanoa ishikariensis]|uniref:LVIVD repeat-containing protein n=1 Tax=Asanoa ishikariensis TaxID=137265 RepID=A0A1H3UQE0_9ACTN|nr:hypothetical protein [Asanoa ishikariensis]GIF69066.1 hypothetical protein Ais01nite_71010 [Asanoa ishikariensis]SDZ63979.1 hypothetical protein SAMN05421684_7636 [Asanoa ishikariensis]